MMHLPQLGIGTRWTPHVERCAREYVPFDPRPVTIPGPGRSTAHPRQAVSESTNVQPHPYLPWRRVTARHERQLLPTSNTDRWTAFLFTLSPTRLRTLGCISTPCHSRAINGGIHGTLRAARDRESRSAPSTHPCVRTVPKLTVRVRFPSPVPNAKSVAAEANQAPFTRWASLGPLTRWVVRQGSSVWAVLWADPFTCPSVALQTSWPTGNPPLGSVSAHREVRSSPRALVLVDP